jgi:hypothetical protein
MQRLDEGIQKHTKPRLVVADKVVARGKEPALASLKSCHTRQIDEDTKPLY